MHPLQRHISLLSFFLILCLSIVASKTIDSSSSSSLSRGESSFADEVRQNTNQRRHRYSHVRRTWLAARERTLQGRRLERLQSDEAVGSNSPSTTTSTSSSLPPMFMVEAQPIKNSIDELQAVVLRQSSQGYKDMLRALMVSSFYIGGAYRIKGTDNEKTKTSQPTGGRTNLFTLNA